MCNVQSADRWWIRWDIHNCWLRCARHLSHQSMNKPQRPWRDFLPFHILSIREKIFNEGNCSTASGRNDTNMFFYYFKDLFLFCTLKPVKEGPMLIQINFNVELFWIMHCKLNGSIFHFQCIFLRMYSTEHQCCIVSFRVKSWSETRRECSACDCDSHFLHLYGLVSMSTLTCTILLYKY